MKKLFILSISIFSASFLRAGTHTLLRNASTIISGTLPNARLDPSSVTLQGNKVNISTVASGLNNLQTQTVNPSSATLQGNTVSLSSTAQGVNALNQGYINASSYTLQGNTVTISTVAAGLNALLTQTANPSSATLQGNTVSLSSTAQGVNVLNQGLVNASSYTLQGNSVNIATVAQGVNNLTQGIGIPSVFVRDSTPTIVTPWVSYASASFMGSPVTISSLNVLGTIQSTSGIKGSGVDIGVDGNSVSGYGVYGHSTNDRGIYGESTLGHGIEGNTKGNGTAGVRGYAEGGGSSYGLYGLASGDSSIGVYGKGTSIGVHGARLAGGGAGTIGVYGENNSDYGYGVSGYAGTTGGVGVKGVAGSPGGIGVTASGILYDFYGAGPLSYFSGSVSIPTGTVVVGSTLTVSGATVCISGNCYVFPSTALVAGQVLHVDSVSDGLTRLIGGSDAVGGAGGVSLPLPSDATNYVTTNASSTVTSVTVFSSITATDITGTFHGDGSGISGITAGGGGGVDSSSRPIIMFEWEPAPYRTILTSAALSKWSVGNSTVDILSIKFQYTTKCSTVTDSTVNATTFTIVVSSRPAYWGGAVKVDPIHSSSFTTVGGDYNSRTPWETEPVVPNAVTTMYPGQIAFLLCTGVQNGGELPEGLQVVAWIRPRPPTVLP